MDTLSSVAPPRAPHTLTDRTMWLILATVLTADALDLMDSTLTNIAAPTIAADLGGGEVLIKWLGSAYALTLGVLLVLGGRIGDKFGHRRTFLVGIAGFTAASVVCGLAPNEGVIVAGRLLQGAFGALLIPQGMAIMTSSFSREFLGKAFSAFGPTLAVASVGGPLLGAFLVDADLGGLGWRPMFLLNIVLGAAGFVLAWRVLPRTEPDGSVVLDGLGSGLLAGAMFCLIYGLIEGPSNGWSAAAVTLVAGGVVLFAAFALRLRHARNPLILPSLLRNRGFTAGLVLGLGFFAVITGLTYVVSLFLQQGLGRTPVQTALTAVAPMAVGIIISSVVAAPLIQRLGRTLILLGLVVTLVGVAATWAVVAASGLSLGSWSLVAPMIVVGLGMGTCFGTLFDIALGDVAPTEAGSASGSLSAVQQLAGAIGSAAITSIWFRGSTADPTAAMTTCLAVVAAVTLGCCALTRLLPRQAQPQEH